MTPEDEAKAREHRCSSCGAAPGASCLTSGKREVKAHRPRLVAAGLAAAHRNSNAGASEIPDAVRKAVRARSGGRCEADWGGGRCKRRARCQHHVWRSSRGGPSEAWNLLDLCVDCHDRIHRWDAALALELGLLRRPPPSAVGSPRDD